MGRPGRLVLLAVVSLLAMAGPATAESWPDLAAFSGCVAAHNALAGVARGDALALATVPMIASSVGVSKTKGASKIAKGLRKAKRAAKAEAALRATAAWCVAVGVPPITVPTTDRGAVGG